jgi:hypothetical protein
MSDELHVVTTYRFTRYKSLTKLLVVTTYRFTRYKSLTKLHVVTTYRFTRHYVQISGDRAGILHLVVLFSD